MSSRCCCNRLSGRGRSSLWAVQSHSSFFRIFGFFSSKASSPLSLRHHLLPSPSPLSDIPLLIRVLIPTPLVSIDSESHTGSRSSTVLVAFTTSHFLQTRIIGYRALLGLSTLPVEATPCFVSVDSNCNSLQRAALLSLPLLLHRTSFRQNGLHLGCWRCCQDRRAFLGHPGQRRSFR